jgi:predicted RNA-binding protein YlxR (DUF448 family)
MQNKKIEKQIRKCIITGNHLKKSDMIRIVSFQGGDIKIDLTGKANGRGCYISNDINNIELIEKKGEFLLGRVFKKKISQNEIAYLLKELPIAFEEKKFRRKNNDRVVLRIRKEDLPKKI